MIRFAVNQSVLRCERRWYPDEEAFKKKLKHRALDDIRESLAEMKFYQNVYFRSREEVAKFRHSGETS